MDPVAHIPAAILSIQHLVVSGALSAVDYVICRADIISPGILAQDVARWITGVGGICVAGDGNPVAVLVQGRIGRQDPRAEITIELAF